MAAKGYRGSSDAADVPPPPRSATAMEAWLSTTDMAEFLKARRTNDIRVNIDGVYVPVIDVHYNRTADMVVIELDEGSDDWKMALGQ